MAELFRNKLDYYQVEAVLLTAQNAEAVTVWCGGVYVTEHDALEHDVTYAAINVPTLQGMVRAQEGDWIIKHPKGDFQTLKPDSFEHIYEAVVDG